MSEEECAAAFIAMSLAELRELAKSNSLLPPLLQLEEEADAREEELDTLRVQAKQLELSTQEAKKVRRLHGRQHFIFSCMRARAYMRPRLRLTRPNLAFPRRRRKRRSASWRKRNRRWRHSRTRRVSCASSWAS